MAFGRIRQDTNDVRAEINMIPLIDVMLVLLIIFILTAPLVTQSVSLKLPEAVDLEERKESLDDKKPILIAIDGTARLYINNEEVTDEALLIPLLEEVKQGFSVQYQGESPLVRLHIDSKVEYEKVAKTLAALNKAGLNNIGFVTMPEEP